MTEKENKTVFLKECREKAKRRKNNKDAELGRRTKWECKLIESSRGQRTKEAMGHLQEGAEMEI